MTFHFARRLYDLWTHPRISRLYAGHEVHAGTFGAGYAASAHLFIPLTKVSQGVLKGYEVGMRKGAIEWVITDAGIYLLSSWMVGLPLHIFEVEAWVFVEEMKVYGNRIHRPMCEMYLQCALNLMGKGEGHLTSLQGLATREYNIAKVMDGTEPHFPAHITSTTSKLRLRWP